MKDDHMQKDFYLKSNNIFIVSMIMDIDCDWCVVNLFQVMFQYAARHSPLRIEHLLASIESSNHQETTTDADMLG